MNALDKIYAAAYDPSLEKGFLTCSTVPMKHDDVEYIRKDAVLELLQNRNKEIRGAAHCAFRSFELQEIYRRINEL